MDSPQINVAIEELMFSLFQRPLHPELFQIYAKRQINAGKYETIIWVTGCTHVVSVFSGDICLTDGRIDPPPAGSAKSKPAETVFQNLAFFHVQQLVRRVRRR